MLWGESNDTGIYAGLVWVAYAKVGIGRGLKDGREYGIICGDGRNRIDRCRDGGGDGCCAE